MQTEYISKTIVHRRSHHDAIVLPEYRVDRHGRRTDAALRPIYTDGGDIYGVVSHIVSYQNDDDILR
eukprot:scaffold164721_cov19-Prasinocladus_malaysianus.AAC.1